jgi:methionyl-tRNA formyltransferase
MRVVFFGSTEYSVEVLRGLLEEGIKPVLVVTKPDSPKGRGLKVSGTEVKDVALKSGLEVVTPTNIREKDFLALIKSKSPDIYIVVSYGKILPKSLLDIPSIVPLGLHPSLLPKYRGPAPINWALINGETKTGVMLFKLEPGMDEGPILARANISIEPEDDFLSLSKKIYSSSKSLLAKNLPLIAKKDFVLTAQEESGISLAPKIDKESVKIDWGRDAATIRNLVRGVMPSTCAWSFFRGKRVKFWEVSAGAEEKDKAAFGEITLVSKHDFRIKVKESTILPKRIQPEGKKPMEVIGFINGYHPKAGEKFT